MAQTTWKQVVYDAADAYREASKTTDKIPVGQLANLIRQGAGGEDVTAEVTEYETLLETAIANLAGKAFKPMQSKTVTPTAAGLTVTPDEGQSLGEVIINGDADLIAENIRQGIDIFGVIGAMSEGVNLPSLFGYTKMVVDKIVVSTDSTTPILTHSLGVKPKFAMLFTSISNYKLNKKSFMYMERNSNRWVEHYFYNNVESSNISKRLTCTLNNTQIIMSNGDYPLGAGIEYTLITMA